MTTRHKGGADSQGMGRDITRRDFLDGVAVSAGLIGAGLPAIASASPQDDAGYYPPALTGLRGDHAGSFEAAHLLRDGAFWAQNPDLEATGEAYDLVIVGGGISGLAAARFYRRERPGARILILDNHDDFGGHAKRNEFHLGGKLHLLNGGTLGIDSPRPYSPVADGLIKGLGIDPPALAKACEREEVYSSLGLKAGVFFDKETFGVDRLVLGATGDPYFGAAGSWPDFLAKAPVSDSVRADILRIQNGRADYMPGLSSAQKKDRLSRISYRDFLLQIVKVDPATPAFYQSHTHGEWGVGIDAVSALDSWGIGMPGFQGLHLAPGGAPRMGYTPAGYAAIGGSYKFHFPDGNATIARLLVRDLIPDALPGNTCEDAVTAKLDYAQIDRPANPVRIRLSSVCLRARNLEDGGVSLAYARFGRVYGVRAKAAILASWNMMIPYLCPEMSEAQKAALHQLVKTPLVYTSVALRNWTAIQKLGLRGYIAPGSYFAYALLNWPVDIGGYRSERSPEEPILLHLERAPCRPGLTEFEQNKAGRAELLTTPFETFEHNIRDQLGRSLADGGFDPARDIAAITVNRWAHGYAPEYNPLFQPDLPEAEQPNVIARARFGRIAIANSDAGRAAYTSSAIDQAHRAVGEILDLDRAPG